MFSSSLHKHLSSWCSSRPPPLDHGTPSTLSLMLSGSQDGSSEGEFLTLFGAPSGHCCRVLATLSRTGSYLNVHELPTKYLSSLCSSRPPFLDLGTPSMLSLMLLGSQDETFKGEFLTVFGAPAGHFCQVSASPSRMGCLWIYFLPFYKIH